MYVRGFCVYMEWVPSINLGKNEKKRRLMENLSAFIFFFCFFGNVYMKHEIEFFFSSLEVWSFVQSPDQTDIDAEWKKLSARGGRGGCGCVVVMTKSMSAQQSTAPSKAGNMRKYIYLLNEHKFHSVALALVFYSNLFSLIFFIFDKL